MLFIAILAVFLANPEEIKTRNVGPKKTETAATKADVIDQQFEKVLEKDDAVEKQVEKMVDEFHQFEAKGAAGPRGVLLARIDELHNEVKKQYDDFLQKHPKHVDAYLAYGSFLNDIGEEEGAIAKWEKARELDPKNPAPWNNLANIFGHHGPVKKAFQYYEKAVELDPTESVYLQNLAVMVYMFRKDAAEMYRIDEKQVFDKALDLYRSAMKLDPTNLVLATEFAQSYYGIQPPRVEDARAAWNHCLTLAKNDVERQGIYLHLARVEIGAGRFNEAQKHLDMVKDSSMDDLKSRLQRNLEKKRSESAKGDREKSSKPEKND